MRGARQCKDGRCKDGWCRKLESCRQAGDHPAPCRELIENLPHTGSAPADCVRPPPPPPHPSCRCGPIRMMHSLQQGAKTPCLIHRTEPACAGLPVCSVIARNAGRTHQIAPRTRTQTHQTATWNPLSQAGVLCHFHHFVEKMLPNLPETQNPLPHTRRIVFLTKIEI